MERHGEYDGNQGLGQHFSIDHSKSQFVKYLRVDDREYNITQFRHLVTTNHMEATWNQLKNNVYSSSEFLDRNNNVVRAVTGYMNAYIFRRRV